MLDLSWYGDSQVELALGGSFHSSAGSASGPVRWVPLRQRGVRATRHAQRLALALDLLRDPAFDALLTGDSPFDELPDVMPRLADGSLPAICHTISLLTGSRCSA